MAHSVTEIGGKGSPQRTRAGARNGPWRRALWEAAAVTLRVGAGETGKPQNVLSLISLIKSNKTRSPLRATVVESVTDIQGPELILVAKGLTSQVPESAPSEAEHWVGSEEGPPSPPVGGRLFPFAPGSRVFWDPGFLVQKMGQFWANRGSWSSSSSLGRWWEDMEGAGDTPSSTACARAEPGSTAVKRAAGRHGSCWLLASTHLLGEQ